MREHRSGDYRGKSTSSERRRLSHLASKVSIASIAAALFLLAVAVTPTLAATSHVFTTTFGAAATNPANPYPLSNPADVAVDNSSGASAGDIYVTDPANHRVEKFDPSGNFILMFGKDVDQSTGANVCTAASHDTCQAGTAGASPGEFQTPTFVSVDSSGDSSSGDVYVGDTEDHSVSKFDPSGNLVPGWATGGQLGGFTPLFGLAVNRVGELFVQSENAHRYTEAGNQITEFGVPRGTSPDGLAVDAEDNLYKADGSPEITKFTDKGENLGEPDSRSDAVGLTVDPTTNDLYVVQGGEGGFVGHFALNCGQSCAPLDEFGAGQLTDPTGIAIAASSDDVYIANSGAGNVATFDGVAPYITTGLASHLTQTSATISGHLDPAGRGNITECHFEYGATSSYGHSVPCSPDPAENPPGSNFTVPTDVSAELSGLQTGTTYHYRLTAGNATGGGTGGDQTFATVQPPSIDGLNSSAVTATTADLEAKINPNGAETTCFFEYGATSAYGLIAACPNQEAIGSGEVDVPVSVHLTGLEANTVYHFRVVAVNEWGTTRSEDLTFNFYPPKCPNAHVRQQTGSEFLPDCRAYELVSPENAGNVVMFPGGAPAAPYATNPARFAFDAGLGGIEGTDPTNGLTIDTYVATRTSTGWITKYIGIPGNQTVATKAAVGDLGLDKFIDFKSNEAFVGTPQPESNLPYVWDFNDNPLGRWPANLTSIPGADATSGAYQPSPDFSHLAFSSTNVAFTSEGLTSGVGSAYDYNTSAETTNLISKTASGPAIPPADGYEHFITFPGGSRTYGDPTQNRPSVSTDGSHILMAAPVGPEEEFSSSPPPPPVVLYMRVNDSVTFEVSEGHAVNYVGMTSDGSKVFFTSEEQLTPEDHDTSSDLYMWSEATDSIKLISLGNNGAGNSDECDASWIAGCGVLPIAQTGNGRPTYTTIRLDTPIASESGDIYFYSPEQLDGNKGELGQTNLYVYREGAVQFVTTLSPGAECDPEGEERTCGNGPITRIQVTPTDSRLAFITASKVTSYDNAGFQEMYTYEPATGKIVCVSCLPSGAPPSGNVVGSEGGLFMSNDGRTFFYTPDALVPQDTNELHDVYEFVDGRAQLISTGIGAEDAQTTPNQYRQAGLQGVSADGVNVYFSTFNTLVPQDHNGQFLKFYDARTDGGFPYTPPPAPCAAADECHGAGSSPPPPPPIVSEASSGSGGNAVADANLRRRRSKHHQPPVGRAHRREKKNRRRR